MGTLQGCMAVSLTFKGGVGVSLSRKGGVAVSITFKGEVGVSLTRKGGVAVLWTCNKLTCQWAQWARGVLEVGVKWGGQGGWERAYYLPAADFSIVQF